MSWLTHLLFVVIPLTQLKSIFGFIYPVEEKLGSHGQLTYSERYMFGSYGGPVIMTNGEAIIEVDVDMMAHMYSEESIRIAVAVFGVDNDHHYDIISNMCGGIWEETYEDWAKNVYRGVFRTEFKARSTETEANGGSLWGTTGYLRYRVLNDGWYNVAFKICDNDAYTQLVDIKGHIAFQNPYGYLPGEMWGTIPFQFSRAISFTIFGMMFLWLFLLFKESVMSLHVQILGVFALAILESIAWTVAYMILNENGNPYCCPFSNHVVLAMCLQVLRQTFSRYLLLVVSLGYGIVRPKLMGGEWCVVGIVTIIYLIASMIAKVAEIVVLNSNPFDGDSSIQIYQLPALVMDILFLTWIYIALSSTVRLLKDLHQTIKLKMYVSLQRCILIFIFLVFALHLGILSITYNVVDIPWKFAWVDNVLWDVFNFCVLVTVCYLCRPSPVFLMRSDREQLSQDDDDSKIIDGPETIDDDEDNENLDFSIDEGIEMNDTGEDKPVTIP
jgi:hypothetical protein